MFPNLGAVKRPVPYEILGRIRRHFVGRVVTLAVATAFNAILSVVFYPSQPDIWGQATRGFMEGSSPIRENMRSEALLWMLRLSWTKTMVLALAK